MAVTASVVVSAVAVTAVMVTLAGGVREDVRSFRTRVNTRMDGFDTRLRNVQVAFAKVDQRLLTLEPHGSSAGVGNRACRCGTGACQCFRVSPRRTFRNS